MSVKLYCVIYLALRIRIFFSAGISKSICLSNAGFLKVRSIIQALLSQTGHDTLPHSSTISSNKLYIELAQKLKAFDVENKLLLCNLDKINALMSNISNVLNQRQIVNNSSTLFEIHVNATAGSTITTIFQNTDIFEILFCVIAYIVMHLENTDIIFVLREILTIIEICSYTNSHQ